jgi:uncharacterized membrane protein YeaQ/YmgE (transglycosylase-associated protein family)
MGTATKILAGIFAALLTAVLGAAVLLVAAHVFAFVAGN